MGMEHGKVNIGKGFTIPIPAPSVVGTTRRTGTDKSTSKKENSY
jgi:hypothetical protein